MAKLLLLCTPALLLTSTFVDCSRILGVFPFPSRSHHILGKCLLKALAEKGHQVTMLSPFSEKESIPNYRQIELTGLLDMVEEKMQLYAKASLLQQIRYGFEEMPTIIRAIITNPRLAELIDDPNEKFDLVIQFWAFPYAFLGIADHFNASVIGFSPTPGNFFLNLHAGNPTPYSYVPHLLFSFTDRMTFFQRLVNTFINLIGDLILNTIARSVQERLYEEIFPNGTPLQTLVDDVNLFLVNSHYSTETIRPSLPNVINIGGCCVDDQQTLPKGLQAYLDGAQEGFIYVSFGSNIKASHLNDQQIEALVQTLSKQEMKVLWKFEGHLPNRPDNVITGDWFPQKAVMAHPNLKLLICHGGIGGVTEAIYNGVPFVGIPFFGDQDSNVADAVQKGYAEKVALSQLSEETLSQAVAKVLKESSFRDNMQMSSAIYREREIKPIDRAIFWVEYAITYKGAKHLKAVSSDLPFYQYYLLDVIVFILVVSLTMVIVIYWVSKIFVQCVCRSMCKNSATKKLKKT